MSGLRVGVVGVGHLGRNHARVYHELDRTDLVGIVDADARSGAEVAELYGVPHHERVEGLIGAVDAVGIATPTPAHLETALPFIEAGVAVLVEKPLASTLAQADELIAAAERHGVTLQVGHIERFNPVLVAALPHIHDPLFIECDRIHPFSLRSTEVSVVLDLMIHDIDIVLHITDDEIDELDALGAPVLSPSEDLATARLTFQHGCTAMVKTSRVALNRSRKVRVFSERCYISLDLVGKRGSRTYLAEGYDPRDYMDEHGRIVAPEGEAAFLQKMLRFESLEIPSYEPLAAELAAFAEAVENGSRPQVTGPQGRRAMAAALRIEERMEFHRRRVAERSKRR